LHEAAKKARLDFCPRPWLTHIMIKDGTGIPVPIHGNADLSPGTLQSILKKAGVK